MSENRRHERVLSELELTLYAPESDGDVLDDAAQAQDISPAGFRASTRAQLEKGERARFEMTLDHGDKISGLAEVIWADSDRFGGVVLGMKVLKMSWRDRSRLRGRTTKPGYDFVALARRAAISLFWIVLATGAHNIAFHQPEMREVVIKLTPVMGATFMLILGLYLAKGFD